jgi:predicted membrane metal-binding protein
MRVIRLLAILATFVVVAIGVGLWAGAIPGFIAAVLVGLLLLLVLDRPIGRSVAAWFVQYRVAVAVIAALAIAGVAWFAAFGDPAHPFARRAPTSGSVEVGVEYRVTLVCSFETRFQLGDYVWQASGEVWPPEQPGHISSVPLVPGSLTLSSPTQGVFVANVDGSRLNVTRVEPYRDDSQLLSHCM